MMARVKFFHDQKGFGFLELDSKDGDFFFHANGYRRPVFARGKHGYDWAECPPISTGLQVKILDHCQGEKGLMASEWTIPSLDEQVEVYAVVKMSVKKDDEYVADKERRCYVKELHKVEEILFIGTQDECEVRSIGMDTKVIPTGKYI